MKVDESKVGTAFLAQIVPSKLTKAHLLNVYHLSGRPCKQCRRNCALNPKCLWGLGESVWLAEEKQEPEKKTEVKEECRAVGEFVGLRNLGATCYVNSFLQLWFHNIVFRQAILSWNPADDPEDRANKSLEEELFVPNSSIGNLQVIFALMQDGLHKVLDTNKFVNSLGIDASVQQDAEEFCKLFLSLLERKLQYQSKLAIRNLVQDQFGGMSAYVTKCLVCQTESEHCNPFLELQLVVSGSRSSLSECFANLIQEERLVDLNQYHCSVCMKKVDAIRTTRITRVPPVLLLQLMRINFDRNTGRRKKLNAHVDLPESLDLSIYANNMPSPLIYQLQAVLVHGGASAYSGHYIAYIYNHKLGCWFKFNDEEVAKVSKKEMKELLATASNKDNNSGEAEAKPNSGRARNFSGGNSKNNGEGFLSFKNAYLVVYVSKEQLARCDQLDDSGLACDKSHLYLQRLVDKTNDDFKMGLAEERALVAIAAKAKRNKQEFVRSLHPKMMLQGPSSKELDLVSVAWLKQWLKNTHDSDVPKIDNSALLCLHGKVSLHKVRNYKAVTCQSADVLCEKFGCERRLHFDDLCYECSLNTCKAARLRAEISEHQKFVTQLLRKKNGVEGFWIGKSSLRSWSRMAIEEHVKPLEAAAQEAKKSENDLEDAKPSEVDVVNKPTADDHVSTDNLETPDQSVTSTTSNSDSDAVGCGSNCDELPANMSCQSAGTSEASSKLTTETNNISPDLENAENGDSEDEELRFNQDIVCEHGGLVADENPRRLVPSDVWRILIKYFPSAPEFAYDSATCLQCEAHTFEDQQTASDLRQTANRQKSDLGNIFRNKQRPDLVGGGDPELKRVYLIPSSFVESWKCFLRSPTLKNVVDTSSLQDDLLCPHGGLLYHLEPQSQLTAPSDQNRPYPVTEEEWKHLVDHFGIGDKAIRVERSGGVDSALVSTPPVCVDCVKARELAEQRDRFRYDRAVLHIRRMEPDDEVAIISRVQEQEQQERASVLAALEDSERSSVGLHRTRHSSSSTLTTGSDSCDLSKGSESKRPKLEPSLNCNSNGSGGGLSNLRRSSRQKKRGDSVAISGVHSGLSVKELKLKIMEKLKVAPFDQHLFFNQMEILDPSATLESLEILPDSTIYIKTDEECSSFDEIEDVDPMVSCNDGRSPVKEHGFKGTQLMDF